MATKSVTLKDSNGDTLYPVTDSNVVNINQQKTLAQALDGVVYAEDPTQSATPTAWVTNSDIDWSTFGDQTSYFDIGNIRVAFGSATLTSIESGAETPKSVSFGISFSTAPVVTFTVANWIPVAFQVVSSANTTSFNALVKHYFGSTLDIPINWIAIGAKA